MVQCFQLFGGIDFYESCLIDETVAADVANFKAEVCRLPLAQDSVALYPPVFDERIIVANFVDIQDVYEGIKNGERVIFVLRHAERGNDTSRSGTLTDNGKKQSEEVGARLKKFDEDFVLGASEFLRAHQTVESMAKGRGQAYDKRDTLPQLNDDWYIKDKDIMSKVNDEAGGGWHSTSKYAYTGAYTTGANAAFYNLAERSVELIEDVLVKKYSKEKFVLLSSHDKVMVPLVAYCSNLKIELKEYDGGKWINYLAGVAIQQGCL